MPCMDSPACRPSGYYGPIMVDGNLLCSDSVLAQKMRLRVESKSLNLRWWNLTEAGRAMLTINTACTMKCQTDLDLEQEGLTCELMK